MGSAPERDAALSMDCECCDRPATCSDCWCCERCCDCDDARDWPSEIEAQMEEAAWDDATYNGL